MVIAILDQAALAVYPHGKMAGADVTRKCEEVDRQSEIGVDTMIQVRIMGVYLQTWKLV
jgi:hypothetical protein